MAWGKIAGGILGAMVGGPLGAGIGAGLGHLFDSEPAPVDEPEYALLEAIEFSHGHIAPQGPALAFRLPFEAFVPLHDPVVVYRLRRTGSGAYVRATHADFRDDDGDFLGVGVVHEDDQGQTVALGLVPYAVVERVADATVALEVTLGQDPDGILGRGLYELPWQPQVSAAHERNRLSALTLAGVQVARSGGALEREAVREIRESLQAAFDLDQVGQGFLKDYLKRANAHAHTPAAVGAELAPFIDADAHPSLFAYLADVARSDGPLDADERRYLRTLGGHLGVDAGVLDQCLGPVPALLDEHFRTLELEPDADWDTIRSAYRRLARDYHPDRVQHLPEGFRRFATERLQAINAAYEALRRARAPA